MLDRVKRIWVPVRGVWSDRPSVDWLLVAVAVGSHIAVAHWTRFDFILDELSKADRMRVFTTTASVSALLFGFATASIAFFYGSARGERVELLKSVMSKQILAAWRASLSAPLITVGACLVALVVDTGKTGLVAVGWSVEVAVILLAVRAVRLRWLFTTTLSLMSLDATDPKSVRRSSQPPTAAAKPKRRTAEI